MGNTEMVKFEFPKANIYRYGLEASCLLCILQDHLIKGVPTKLTSEDLQVMSTLTPERQRSALASLKAGGVVDVAIKYETQSKTKKRYITLL